MPESDAVVAIVDDDPWALDGLQRLIRSAGWRAETFASAQAFLARPGADEPACLVLDLHGAERARCRSGWRGGLEIHCVTDGHGDI